jgi:hypothetical protein
LRERKAVGCFLIQRDRKDDYRDNPGDFLEVITEPEVARRRSRLVGRAQARINRSVHHSMAVALHRFKAATRRPSPA